MANTRPRESVGRGSADWDAIWGALEPTPWSPAAGRPSHDERELAPRLGYLMPMPRTTRARRLLPSVTTQIALLLSTWALPAGAQQVEELIRAHVEQLSATGDLELDGVTIAGRNLLPRIYEARAFAPTWRSLAQIDSLLETIDASYHEGLDPAITTSTRCALRARRSRTSTR